MTKKIGIVLASLAVVVLIGASGYALAGEKTNTTKTKQTAKTATTATVDAKAAADKNAKSGCAATCATPCTAGAKASTSTKTDATNAVNSAHPVSCTGAKNASGQPTCTPAEKAACKAAGIDCSTKHSAKNASAVKTASAGCSATCASHATKSASCSPAEKAACEAAGYSCTTKGTVKTASSNVKSSSASCSAAEKAACNAAGVKCSSTCSSGAKKASYAANVYKVENGVMYAVADGKRFVVTGDTPYTEVGNARYYFADEHCAVKCPTAMSQKASNYNMEAGKMTTQEANVKLVDGKKMATCCSSEMFEVTDSTPYLVMDGKKVYYCSEKCAGNRMAMAN